MTEKMIPREGEAIVRMYCTGLGDCFLLAFLKEGGETGYVLIDCGVWKGAPGARDWMRTIMEHIRTEVGARGLDLLVVTHQHWDHLSGFGQAQEIFAQIPVKAVWLPWTENPQDGQALKLAEERRLAFLAAAAAAARMRLALGTAEGAPPSEMEELLQFSGYAPGIDLGLGARLGTEDLLEIVRRRVDQPQYLRPSLTPLHLEGVSGLRIYALGPPTDLKLLGRDDPSTAPGKSEVYLAPGVPLNESSALYAAALPAEAGSDPALDRERREMLCPFDSRQRRPRLGAAADPTHGAFFSAHYLNDPAWRKIDTDWIDAAAQLALNLDDHINNTSLVLAFELGEGGPVLLFPGDAQVGNWLSWHKLQESGGVSARSLLNRTVLYKVGHHASHNATLKDLGLKMMLDTRRLVAMIPVDEVEAHKPKGKNADGWDMPYGNLLTDLVALTEGRIARADCGLGDPGNAVQDAARERWEAFHEATRVETAEIEIQGKTVTRPLFIQHTVRG